MRWLSLVCLLTLHLSTAHAGFKLFAKNLTSQGLNYPRDIYVYLPQGYHSSSEHYPVIYMHDGQNLFDPQRVYLGQTWNAERTLDYLIRERIIRPVIVVGVDNTPDRKAEHTPGPSEDSYLSFLVHL